MQAALNTGQREVFILPTRFGIMYAIALFLMLMVSVNYNNGLGHLFTFVMASIGVVCMYYTQRNLVGLEGRVNPGRAVFAGESAVAKVRIAEQINRPRSNIWLRCGSTEQLFNLDSAQSCDISVSLETEQRGWLKIPEIYLCTLYPLGIFLSWSRKFRTPTQLLVYPKLAPAQPLPHTGDGEKELVEGDNRSGIDDFSGIREHQYGDALNRIHWKHSARGNGLKTKLFQGMSAGDLVLRWQDTSGVDDEARLSILARWVVDADSAAYRYALDIPGVTLKPESGPHHRHQCLKALALWQA